jgi:hypothetical protein
VDLHACVDEHLLVDAVQPGDLAVLVGKERRPVEARLADRPAVGAKSFFGMQPTLTQVPPKRPGSAIATLAPYDPETRLARTPPEPPPIVKRS